MKVFIGGSKELKGLPPMAVRALDAVLRREDEVLIGDCNGIDRAVQEYLNLSSYRKVTVYASCGKARNNVGAWPIRTVPVPEETTGYEFYKAKDDAMALDADTGLMIWDEKSKGTWHNILSLAAMGKKVLLFSPSLEAPFEIIGMQGLKDYLFRRLPISETYWNFYRSGSWRLKDSYLATEICNARLPRKTRQDLLARLASLTEDMNLSGQIREHLAWEKAVDSTLADNKACRAVYLVKTDGLDQTEGCFSSLEEAIKFGHGHCDDTYDIYKWKLDAEDGNLGSVGLDKEGRVRWLVSHEVESEISQYDSARFEYQFIPLKQPFEKGDLVRTKNGDRLGVVRTAREDWEGYCEHHREGISDYSDVQIVVEFLDVDGYISHAHIHPADLEKVTSWPDLDQWALMCYVSRSMRDGTFSAEEFMMFTDDYRNWLKAKRTVECGTGLECLYHFTGGSACEMTPSQASEADT